MTNSKYFLASNSCEGFTSYFGDCYRSHGGWKVYIIKGGPGTGKSSFMKFIAAKADELSLKTVLCPCSSDPDSLDALILPEKKTAVLDGTSPHTLEPQYPGVCEQILNFGAFWDCDKLLESRAEILETTDRNRSFHRYASDYMKSAGELISDSFKTAKACTDTDKTRAFAEEICKKHISKSGEKSEEWVRFIGSVTPKGLISFTDTPLSETEKHIIIKDDCGFAASDIISKIRSYALGMNYGVITVLNPFLPSKITDGIIIPELSLCVMREYEYSHFKTDERRIHARRFTKSRELSKSRKRIKANKKASEELLLSASQMLYRAKNVHDELEAYYKSAMDFKHLSEFANDFAEKLLKQ